MKLFFLFIILACFACKNKSVSTNKPVTDTLTPVVRKVPPKRNLEVLDQHQAYGKVKFGMGRDQAERLLNFTSQTTVGERKYDFLANYTRGDSIYFLEINSPRRTALYYETETQAEWTNLVKTMTEEFGEPDIQKRYPFFTEMKNGFIAFTHEWYIGDKYVKIGIAEDGSDYYAVGWIFSNALKRQADQQAYESAKAKTATK